MRLIDVDALIDDVMDRYCSNCDRRKGMKRGKLEICYDIGDAPCRSCGIGDVLDDVEDFPAADVVEVVRCEDCYWFDRRRGECHNPRYGNGWANYPPPSVDEEYFCADGERKDGADE